MEQIEAHPRKLAATTRGFESSQERLGARLNGSPPLPIGDGVSVELEE